LEFVVIDSVRKLVIAATAEPRAGNNMLERQSFGSVANWLSHDPHEPKNPARITPRRICLCAFN
jgi:hypothetical protein